MGVRASHADRRAMRIQLSKIRRWLERNSSPGARRDSRKQAIQKADDGVVSRLSSHEGAEALEDPERDQERSDEREESGVSFGGWSHKVLVLVRHIMGQQAHLCLS
jgi:hypothetical protein